MDVIERFIQEGLATAQEHSDNVYKLVKDFQNAFPISSIVSMTLDEYLYASKDDSTQSKSFCSQIWRNMTEMSSMGNCFPNIFGIYKVNGQIKIHGKYLECFGNDVAAAFEYLKKQIVFILEETGKGNYQAVTDNPINSAFKHKLIEIYYPDKFIHVIVKGKLEEYLNRLGIAFGNDDSFITRNLALKAYKDSVPYFDSWTNAVFMWFCVYLCNNNITIDGKQYIVNKEELIKQASDIEKEISAIPCEGGVRDAIVKVRVNQGAFRDLLLKKYESCCLCGVSSQEFLLASHIKPWVDSSPKEKVDVNNGLLLCPNHDKLFDKGFISFDDEGKIMISNELSETDRLFMNIQKDMSMSLSDKNKKYLAYHRKNIFRK